MSKATPRSVHLLLLKTIVYIIIKRVHNIFSLCMQAAAGPDFLRQMKSEKHKKKQKLMLHRDRIGFYQ